MVKTRQEKKLIKIWQPKAGLVQYIVLYYVLYQSSLWLPDLKMLLLLSCLDHAMSVDSLRSFRSHLKSTLFFAAYIMT